MPLSNAHQAKACVGFLFAEPGTDEPEPIGTCFLAVQHLPNGDGEYLVTAKHVLEGLRKAGAGYVRVSAAQGGVEKIELDLGAGAWLVHDDPAVDLAIQPWSEQSGWRAWSIEHDGSAPRTPVMLRETDDVAFTGLMRNFVGATQNLLAIRVGTIALITDEQIEGEYGASEYYVIDAQAYPANSGAPVWVVYAGTCFLLGVLAYPFPAPADLRKVKGTESAYYNLGMTLVVPLGKITEVLDAHGRSRGEAPGA
ncbi:MAG: serine protease [Chloroflexota bacterium]|nr:serine protease [Chloroflexota bacterium]